MEEMKKQVYWAIIHLFVIQKQWKIVYVTDDFEEIWMQHQQQIIRLKNETYDWSNQLRQDLGVVYNISQQLARGVRRGTLHVTNLYFSDAEPVDDWQYAVMQMREAHKKEPFIVQSVIETRTEWIDVLVEISEKLKLNVVDSKALKDQSIRDKEELKREVLHNLNEREQQRKKIFQYANPHVTKVLVGIQIAVFIIMSLSGGTTNPEVLLQFGAKYNPLIEQGEIWRLLTAVFIHIGLLHLIMNTMALYYIGTQLEGIIGNVRFAILYVVAGLGGSISSYLFNPGISAGASGAIFGCFGALFVVMLIYKKIIPQEMIKNIVVLIAVNLAFGFLVPSIDNAAHLGGLIIGTVTMYLLGVPKIQS